MADPSGKSGIDASKAGFPWIIPPSTQSDINCLSFSDNTRSPIKLE